MKQGILLGAGIAVVVIALVIGVIGMYLNGEESTPLPEASLSVEEKTDIPYTEQQLYAVAYIGYDEYSELQHYTDKYLYDENLPFHHLSSGEYYLIIPRYEDMTLSIYENDIETQSSALIYKSPTSHPFVIQGNISDIFSNMTIEFSTDDDKTSFSPYVSLKDGSIMVGDRGLLLTE